MRLYYFLNESDKGGHIDVYSALYNIKNNNIIEDYKIFSFPYYLKTLNSKEVLELSLQEIKRFQPELILFSHTGNFKISESFLNNIRRIDSRVVFGYKDGDIYHPWYKPMYSEIFSLIKFCNVSFWCGCNYYIKKIYKYCSDNRYVPSTTDIVRFNRNRVNEKILYDVVMVGNYIKSKIPFKTFPGSVYRIKIADYFYKKLGNKFRVFGSGFENKNYYGGSIKFDMQGDCYRSSRLTLGFNNLFADYYFSNRLPISLSNQTIMVHNYENGIELPFSKIGYNYFYKDTNEAWKITKMLLERPQTENDKEGEKFKQHVIKNLTIERTLLYILDVMKNYYYSNNKYTIPNIKNPWLNGILLKKIKEV